MSSDGPRKGGVDHNPKRGQSESNTNNAQIAQTMFRDNFRFEVFNNARGKCAWGDP